MSPMPRTARDRWGSACPCACRRRRVQSNRPERANRASQNPIGQKGGELQVFEARPSVAVAGLFRPRELAFRGPRDITRFRRVHAFRQHW